MILQNWWFTTLLGMNEPIRPPLKRHIRADVLIVGAGAAGLSAANYFIGRGLKTVLLEKNICGGSSSGKSAGFLTPDSELELSQLIRRFGITGAKDLWSVPTKGIEMMKSNIHRYQISCDFQIQDSLFLGIGKGGWRDIQEEMKSRKALGFDQILYNETDIQSVIGSKGYSGGVRYKDTYGIDALLYCQGMKKLLVRNDIDIYESSEVISVSDHCARTHLGSVTAEQIIFCADKIEPSLSRYADNIYHAQTFLSISEPLNEMMVKSIFPEDKFQCWDSTLVYSYFRLTGDNRILLGGGSMLTTFSKNDVNSSKVIDMVIRNFKNTFPQLKGLRFIQYWPGRIDSTRDLLPTILKDPAAPWLHFVLGCVGLPWATFCGDFAARHSVQTDQQDDHHYYEYFRADRHFFVPLWMEKIISKQLVFSINNGWAKYYQRDAENNKRTKELLLTRKLNNSKPNTHSSREC
ncbi:MAG: FAD-binding oxidoreductase [Crocinitomicaceae bacterium]|nr:FAD-binding oxidoreductase [Crocinitomicaceae bacterium]